MASLSNDEGGFRRVLVNVDGARKTIRLGKIPKRQAENMLRHIEALSSSRLDGSAPPEETARWLGNASDVLRDRLVRSGLAEPREAGRGATIGTLIDSYRERKFPLYKPGTIQIHEQTIASIQKHWGRTAVLRSITGGDAEDFRDALVKDGLAEATVRKRCAIASKFLRYAIKHRLLDRNPFDDGEVERGNVASPHRQYIHPADAQRVLDLLPNNQWRLLFVLSRWGGLRVGSEPRLLRWGDVDWERHRLSVRSPKTERYAHRAVRVVPLFPELAEALQNRFDEAEEGEELILPMLRGRTDQALRKTLLRAVEKAGLTQWPRLWHNLRASRQTDLEMAFPSHVVCDWLGNSRGTAERHYLMTTDGHFEKAAQKAAQQALATSCNEQQAATGPRS